MGGGDERENGLNERNNGKSGGTITERPPVGGRTLFAPTYHSNLIGDFSLKSPMGSYYEGCGN